MQTRANNCWNLWGTYGSGPSSSDHLWRASVPWKQPIPEEFPAPVQSVRNKFKAPMQATDFDEALTSINPGLRRMTSSWFRGSRTTSRPQAERGLLSLQHRVPHLCTRQPEGHCTGARVEGRDCRRGGEGCTCRCLARAYTHIHSLCLRRQNVQVTCLAGARAFTVCARIHWAFTQFGAGRGCRS